MTFLKGKGIQTSIHYPPVHRFSYYQGLWPPGFDHGVPKTEDAAQRLVTLPLFPDLTESQVDYVAAAVREFFGVGIKTC
jgi:dTDP-4-amino-4,6-dideoxygalactose transaminase